MFISGVFIRGAYTDLYNYRGGAIGSYVLKNQTIKQFQGGGGVYKKLSILQAICGSSKSD